MQEWDYFDKIVKGKGMWLIDSKGNKLLDGVGSMWCNVWGHSKKELINAIIRQTKKIPHSSLFNLTNEPAEDLAKKLIKISPNMNRVFYSDNGSTAMEIAFKLALQYWKNYGHDSVPDIVAYGKMLTGGYLTMGATLTTKKIYDSFLGGFKEMKHFFHGHTFTGNPIAAAVANENLKLYEKNKLIKKIQNTSKIFEKRRDELNQLDLVGDVRNKGMLMGIELVKNKKQKTPISPKKSINKIIFDEGKNNGIYLRTLGNIVMLVPPLAISTKELDLLIDRTILTIKKTEKKYDL